MICARILLRTMFCIKQTHIFTTFRHVTVLIFYELFTVKFADFFGMQGCMAYQNISQYRNSNTLNNNNHIDESHKSFVFGIWARKITENFMTFCYVCVTKERIESAKLAA
jgi:hypothetical protein